MPSPRRLPYFPKDAARELARFHTVVCVDAKRPVAMFGYADAGPSHLLRLEEDRVWDLDVGGDDARNVADVVVGLRDAVAKRLGRHVPASAKHNDDARTGPYRRGRDRNSRSRWTCRSTLSIDTVADVDRRRVHRDATSPATTQKKLTPDAMCAIVAALQPEDCVVVDESLTSGTSYWDKKRGLFPVSASHLDRRRDRTRAVRVRRRRRGRRRRRRVVNLQADGCAAYAPQALWTQARERLNVVTVVCANARYAILELEQMMQRTNRNPEQNAHDVSREPRASKASDDARRSENRLDKRRRGESGVPAARAEAGRRR